MTTQILFGLLESADELITFNGRTCDLIVLEKLLEPEESRLLWTKCHHDLKGWLEQSLESSARRFSPGLATQYGLLRQQRFADLETAYGSNEPLRNALAGTYRDAWITSELARVYCNSDNKIFTFTDSLD